MLGEVKRSGQCKCNWAGHLGMRFALGMLFFAGVCYLHGSMILRTLREAGEITTPIFFFFQGSALLSVEERSSKKEIKCLS